MAPKSPTGRLTELDAMRGLAALLVVLFHYTCLYVEVKGGTRANDVGVWWGHYGVQLFFAISGFVISMSLERTQNAADFVVSRFSRLFPTFWAAMLVTTVAVKLSGNPNLQVDGVAFLANLSMLPSVFGQPPVDGSYWTLAIELQFYLFLFGLKATGRFPSIEKWIAVLAILSFFIARAMPLQIVTLWSEFPWFVLGIAFYRIWTGERSLTQQLPLLALCAGSVTVHNGLASLVIMGLVSSLFILLLKNRLGLFRQPLLQGLGLISYPLYLIHQYVGYSLFPTLKEIGMSRSMMTSVALIVVVVIAWALHHCVEVPSQAFLRTRWKHYRGLQAGKRRVPLIL
jgi:peptidoglycan/LPS O-acetylase OafA/YrhL